LLVVPLAVASVSVIVGTVALASGPSANAAVALMDVVDGVAVAVSTPALPPSVCATAALAMLIVIVATPFELVRTEAEVGVSVV
jgi:hypothetical protein